MRKKIIKTVKKAAVKTTQKKSAQQQKSKPHYNYNTLVSALAKDYDIVINAPPNTKIGDHLKSKGYDSFARVLKML